MKMQQYRLWCLTITLALLISVSKEEKDSCLASNSIDYADALGKAILFFEGQRSGKLPSNQRVKWRGNSALTDGKLDNVNLAGGYYDAGDNVKFGWPMSFSIALLSWAASEYKSQLSDINQLDHLHSAIQWGTDFLLKAHTWSTFLYTQVGDGNSDHSCWERPEDMDTPRTLYKVSSSSPGTEVAADYSAAFASASIAFRDNSKYSSKLLSQSKSLFDLANKYRGSYQSSCPFYCSYSGYQDELIWAATWLYKATNDTRYLQFVLNNQGWSNSATEFSWDSKIVGAQTLLAKEYMAGRKDLAKYKTDLDSFVCSLMPGSGDVQIKTTPGGLLYTRDTANLQYVASAAFVLLHYSKTIKSENYDVVKCSTASFSAAQIRTFAASQVAYILGKNPLNLSYMVGYGSKYPKHVHHRGASIPSITVLPRKVGCKEAYSSWYSVDNPNPNIHVGAIVGGPDSDDRFNDVRSDSGHLEPATYINAAAVGALSGLLGDDNMMTTISDH